MAKAPPPPTNDAEAATSPNPWDRYYIRMPVALANAYERMAEDQARETASEPNFSAAIRTALYKVAVERGYMSKRSITPRARVASNLTARKRASAGKGAYDHVVLVDDTEVAADDAASE